MYQFYADPFECFGSDVCVCCFCFASPAKIVLWLEILSGNSVFNKYTRCIVYVQHKQMPSEQWTKNAAFGAGECTFFLSHEPNKMYSVCSLCTVIRSVRCHCASVTTAIFRLCGNILSNIYNINLDIPFIFINRNFSSCISCSSAMNIFWLLIGNNDFNLFHPYTESRILATVVVVLFCLLELILLAKCKINCTC